MFFSVIYFAITYKYCKNVIFMAKYSTRRGDLELEIAKFKMNNVFRAFLVQILSNLK